MQQLKSLQDKLNKLCSEHDELMTVLQIYDFIPNIKARQLLNKNIASKLSMYEQLIQQIQQNHSRVKIRQEIHQKSIHDEAKTSISIIENKMNTLKIMLQNQHANLINFQLKIPTKNTQAFKDIQSSKKQIQNRIDEHYKQINSAIVQHKTSLQLAALQMKELNVNDDNLLSKYGLICLPKENYDYDKFNHQIEMLKLEIGKPDFRDFFNYTYKNMKSLINKQIQYVNLSKKLMESSNQGEIYKLQRKQIVYIFESSYSNIYYRIKGMKNAAANQLLLMYAYQPNKISVNKLQKSVNQSIRDLENSAQALQDCISELQNSKNS